MAYSVIWYKRFMDFLSNYISKNKRNKIAIVFKEIHLLIFFEKGTLRFKTTIPHFNPVVQTITFIQPSFMVCAMKSECCIPPRNELKARILISIENVYSNKTRALFSQTLERLA